MGASKLLDDINFSMSVLTCLLSIVLSGKGFCDLQLFLSSGNVSSS